MPSSPGRRPLDSNPSFQLRGTVKPYGNAKPILELALKLRLKHDPGVKNASGLHNITLCILHVGTESEVLPLF